MLANQNGAQLSRMILGNTGKILSVSSRAVAGSIFLRTSPCILLYVTYAYSMHAYYILGNYRSRDFFARSILDTTEASVKPTQRIRPRATNVHIRTTTVLGRTVPCKAVSTNEAAASCCQNLHDDN